MESKHPGHNLNRQLHVPYSKNGSDSSILDAEGLRLFGEFGVAPPAPLPDPEPVQEPHRIRPYQARTSELCCVWREGLFETKKRIPTWSVYGSGCGVNNMDIRIIVSIYKIIYYISESVD